jgi:hypothetical protein
MYKKEKAQANRGERLNCVHWRVSDIRCRRQLIQCGWMRNWPFAFAWERSTRIVISVYILMRRECFIERDRLLLPVRWRKLSWAKKSFSNIRILTQ